MKCKWCGREFQSSSGSYYCSNRCYEEERAASRASGSDSSGGCVSLIVIILGILLLCGIYNGVSALGDMWRTHVSGWTELMNCVYHDPDNSDEIDKALVLNDINTRSKDGETALTVAAEQASAGVIKYLLKKGANADVATEDGITPVMLAAARSEIEPLHALLAYATNYSAKDSDGRNAIIYAVEEGSPHADNIKALITMGCAADERNEEKATPLIISCYRSRINSSVTKTLIASAKVDVNARDENGNTALIYAVRHDQNQKAKDLVSIGHADMNVVDDDGDTPIIIAARNKNSDLVDFFVGHGVNPYATNANGESAISIATKNKDAETLIQLKKGSKFNQEK